jgi:hypothetical protein
MPKRTVTTLVCQNLRLVKKLYPDLAQGDLLRLRELTQAHLLSISQGELFVHRWEMVRDARGSAPNSASRAMLRNPDRSAGATVRSSRKALGLPCNSFQIFPLEGIRRLRRCRSIQHFSARPWRRDARCRDASRQ